MKKILVVLLMSAFVACIGSSAQAILVTSGAGTHLNDHFETSTVGNQPNDPPWDAWPDNVFNAANDLVDVTNAGSPGPNKGENYLEFYRSDNSDGRATVEVLFDTPAVGGTFHMEFGLHVVSGSAADNLGAIGPNFTNIVTLWITDDDPGAGNPLEAAFYFWPENNTHGEFRWYDGAAWHAVDWDPLAAATDAWVNLEIDHVMGSGTMRLTIDGGSFIDVAMDATLGGFAAIDKFAFGEGVAAGGFFLDGYVPEPATMLVLAIGGMLSLIRRKR